MGWLEAIFQAVAQGLGLIKQQTDPETIRLSKIVQIQSQLVDERAKRDANLQITRTPENELKLGDDLGLITNNIIVLRQALTSVIR